MRLGKLRNHLRGSFNTADRLGEGVVYGEGLRMWCEWKKSLLFESEFICMCFPPYIQFILLIIVKLLIVALQLHFAPILPVSFTQCILERKFADPSKTHILIKKILEVGRRPIHPLTPMYCDIRVRFKFRLTTIPPYNAIFYVITLS